MAKNILHCAGKKQHQCKYKNKKKPLKLPVKFKLLRICKYFQVLVYK